MPKPVRQPPSLSRDEIVRRALALLAERGSMAQVSMRVLAGEFDVWPNALYQYFRDKDELMSFMLDEVLSGLAPPRGNLRWETRMLRFSLEFRRRLMPYPDLAAFLLTGRGLTPRVRMTNAQTVEIFLGAGWSPEAAARAFAAVRTFVLGSLLLVGSTGDPVRRRREVVDPSALTERDGVVAALAELDQEEVFSFGLSRLLDGLAAEQDRGR